MMISKIPLTSLKLIASSSLIMLVLLIPNGALNAEVALNAGEVLTTGDPTPEDKLPTESPLDFRKTPGWQKRYFGQTLSNPNNLQDGLLQSKNNPGFHLKSPGKLPGIEFGFEMHSLKAFESVVPPESLPKGLDHKQEQPLLLPPSINAPDYNAGFLRFTW